VKGIALKDVGMMDEAIPLALHSAAEPATRRAASGRKEGGAVNGIVGSVLIMIGGVIRGHAEGKIEMHAEGANDRNVTDVTGSGLIAPLMLSSRVLIPCWVVAYLAYDFVRSLRFGAYAIGCDDLQ
jgi:hypothetical protein